MMNCIYSKDIDYHITNNLCELITGLVINFLPKEYTNLEFIFKFPNLKLLKIDYQDNITENDIPNLESLKHLEHLSLRQFNFVKFPSFIKNLNLHTLEISFSYMPYIHPEIYEMSNLRVLKLRYSNICSISDNISNLINLITLDLYDNPIKDISPKIALLKNLESINMAYSIASPKLFFKDYMLYNDHLIIFKCIDFNIIDISHVKHITVLESVKPNLIREIIDNLPVYLESLTIGTMLNFCPDSFPITLKNLRIKKLDLSNYIEKSLRVPFDCKLSIGISIK